MSLIKLFAGQRAAFETAYVNGDWAPLGKRFDENATYEAINGPFHCVLKGRAQVLAGFERSVERFDKLCKRTLGIDTWIQEEGANVIVFSGMRFERDGAPPIYAKLCEIATYRDGLIERMIDIYDPESRAAFEAWMAKWGQGLDPRYTD